MITESGGHSRPAPNPIRFVGVVSEDEANNLLMHWSPFRHTAVVPWDVVCIGRDAGDSCMPASFAEMVLVSRSPYGASTDGKQPGSRTSLKVAVTHYH